MSAPEGAAHKPPSNTGRRPGPDARAAARASAPDYEAQPPDDAFVSDSEFAKPGASAVAWDWNADAMRRDLAAAASNVTE